MRAKLNSMINLKDFMAHKMDTKLKNDFGHYASGKIVAVQFKKLSESCKQIFKHQINNLIFNLKIQQSCKQIFKHQKPEARSYRSKARSYSESKVFCSQAPKIFCDLTWTTNLVQYMKS